MPARASTAGALRAYRTDRERFLSLSDYCDIPLISRLCRSMVFAPASVGAKRTSTGRSAPLPVGCPPVQARRSPSGRIAQKPEVVRNGTASNLSLIENHFIYKIGIFFIPHREIGTPFIIKKAVRKSFCHIRKVKAAAKKPPSADTDQR